jgi:hypothetical protein
MTKLVHDIEDNQTCKRGGNIVVDVALIFIIFAPFVYMYVNEVMIIFGV